MTAISQAITSALLHFVWQGVLVAFVYWIARAILRSASSHTRYFVSCTALGILVALPVITAFVLYRGATGANLQSSVFLGAPPLTPALTGAELPLFAAIQTWVLPVWIAGVAAFATRLIWASRQVAKLQRHGNPAESAVTGTVRRLASRMKIGRSVRVIMSGLAGSPAVAGWLKPVILLPAATLTGLTPGQLEAVLAHELAHIRRHDYLVNLLQALVETLLFYHPAVWWISSRIRAEREFCCDDLAVEICRDPVLYARALTRLERLRAISPELAMSSVGGPLLHRIRRLTGQVPEQSPSKLPALVALFVGVLCLFTNVRWVHAQPQSGSEGLVRKDSIWVDTVKYGEFPIMVRALGTVSSPAQVELKVVASQANQVQSGQGVSIEVRGGVMVAGRVSRVDAEVVNGTVPVTIDLQSPVPEFVGQPVDGVIRIRTLQEVIYVGRPARAETTLFKIEPDGNHARRVKVRFGAFSVNTVQVLEGLQPGDRVILSDMTPYSGNDGVRLE
jgi:beta-lactamase regulating signal transducer with metallopeptidase domain